MAEEASVSDTQALLHSMLQRLKLQTRAESKRTHTPDPEYSPSIQHNGRTTQSPPGTPAFQFPGPTDENPPSEIPAYLKSPSTPSSTGQTTPQFTRETSAHSPGLSLTPEPKAQSRWYLNHHAQSGGNSTVSCPDNPETPTWPWKKKPVQKNLSNSSSVSSTHSIDSLVPPSPTLSSSGGKRVEPGRNKWTQRESGRWNERVKEQNNQQERDMAERSASTVPIQTLPTATDRPATLTEGPDEAPASPSDHMSEPLFSLGSFNLMEEIFTGQEWSKFFLPGFSSQSGSSLIVPEHAMETPGSLSQSRRQEPNGPSQWNYNNVNTSTEGPQQDMDTTDHTLNPTHVSDHSVLPTALVHPGQHGSNRSENMDMSFSPSENAGPRHQSTPVRGSSPLSAGHDQSHDFEVDHARPESSHQEMSHAQELSHLQSTGGSSLRKQFSLNRKRSYSSERERTRQQDRPETGGVHEWRRSATPEYSAPSFSSSSSSSSLQDSMSEGSELSVSSEMAVKKRRVENTRRVHFAEEVTILPPLILSDDEDEDDEDAEAVPQDGVLEFKDCNEDPIEEPTPPPLLPPPRLSVPRWIEALRNKTKRKPKLKLPHISSSRFRIRKKTSVV